MLTEDELNIKIIEKEGIEKRSRNASRFFCALGILSSVILIYELLTDKKYVLLFGAITTVSFPSSYFKYKARKNASSELLNLRKEAIINLSKTDAIEPVVLQKTPNK